MAGVDEVGRGAWAGPVTVAAVVLDPDRTPEGLADSKLLRAEVRTELAAQLRQAARIGLGSAGNDEIDRLGLAAALRLAARRAVDALPVGADLVLLDGNVDLLDGTAPTELVVGGDRRSVSIAAASIVAKVARDAELTAAAAEHPAYGFAANKGYPTPHHRAALAEHGPCALHRMSWAPLAALAQPQLFPTGSADR